jgi:hypothetical protein
MSVPLWNDRQPCISVTAQSPRVGNGETLGVAASLSTVSSLSWVVEHLSMPSQCFSPSQLLCPLKPEMLMPLPAGEPTNLAKLSPLRLAVPWRIHEQLLDEPNPAWMVTVMLSPIHHRLLKTRTWTWNQWAVSRSHRRSVIRRPHPPPRFLAQDR